MTPSTEYLQEITIYQAKSKFHFDLSQKFSDDKTYEEELNERFSIFDGLSAEESVKNLSKASDIIVEVLGLDGSYKDCTLMGYNLNSNGAVWIAEYDRMVFNDSDEVKLLEFEDLFPVLIVKRGE